MDIRFFRARYHARVVRAFSGILGLTIRGRRLLKVLDQLEFAGKLDSAAALTGLQAIHDLFDSLARLVGPGGLKHKLEKAGKLRFGKGSLSYDDFKALESAHEFLLRIFGSPQKLRGQIEAFRPHLDDPAWEHYFPRLHNQKTIKELVRGIEYIWPYNRFRLPAIVHHYLGRSAFIAELRPHVETYLVRYAVLKKDWDLIKKQEDELLIKLLDCEEQRRSAERYSREQHSHPILTLLEPSDSDEPAAETAWKKKRKAVERADPAPITPVTTPDFTWTLQSLLFFNAYLAICENYYFFDGTLCRLQQVKDLYSRIELGNCIGLIRSYLSELRKAGRLADSVFSGWHDRWPTAGHCPQRDAARLAADIAAAILDEQKKYERRLTEHDKTKLRALLRWGADGEECPPEDLLEVLGLLRIKFAKTFDPEFWMEFQASVRDLLRRFVAATTPRDFCFGTLHDDGKHASLWHRHHANVVDVTSNSELYRGRICVFVGPGHHPKFPIDDFIRVHPENRSVWAYYSRESWTVLTNVAGGAERLLAPRQGIGWIPPQAELEKKLKTIWTESRSPGPQGSSGSQGELGTSGSAIHAV